MFTPRQHTIRLATAADDAALRRLAALDSQSPLSGRMLVAEVDDAVVAAIALTGGRTIADPFVLTSGMAVGLRTTRANHLRNGRMPSLRERILAGVRPVVHATPA
jgi:hypothetical protein